MKKMFKDIQNVFIDIKNKKKFKQEINFELDDPNSKMNMFEIKVDKNYSKLSTIITIPEEFQISGTEIDILNKLKEMARPMTQYICFELGWAEYILVPEFFYLDDPTAPGMSKSYLVIWKYAPLIINDKKFWVKMIGSSTAAIGAIAAGTFFLL